MLSCVEDLDDLFLDEGELIALDGPLLKADSASARDGKDLYLAPGNLSIERLQEDQSVKIPVSRPDQTT